MTQISQAANEVETLTKVRQWGEIGVMELLREVGIRSACSNKMSEIGKKKMGRGPKKALRERGREILTMA